jgi:hypothetical protein
MPVSNMSVWSPSNGAPTQLKGIRMKLRALLSACALAVSLPSFAQNTGVVSIEPTLTSMSGIGVFIKGGSEPGDSVLAPTTLSVAAGDRLEFNYFYADTSVAPQYSFLGVYGDSGVVVAVDSSIAASLVGRTWESIFTSPSFSEATVFSTLASFANADPADDDFQGVLALGTYLGGLSVDVNGAPRELFAPLGTESVLLNFSQAVVNGRAILQPVPEPSTWMLAALGGIAIMSVVRRRRR